MKSPRIRDLPETERPREKMASRGPGALTDAELLAICFGSGRPGLSAIDLGRLLIDQFGSLQAISRTTTEELEQINGVGPAKAAQLLAVFEFGKRLARERAADTKVDDPETVYQLLGAEMQSLNQESLRVILLNTRYRVIRVLEITRGSLNESIAHPREILRPAISHSAYAYILAHNHPSGDPSPSTADRKLTRQLAEASRHVGISMLDHVIVGSESSGNNGQPYFSFREAGLL